MVGIDFSACSASALRHALRLAAGFRAELAAVHLIDTLVAIELEEALSPMQKNVRDGLLADARAAWLDFAAAYPGAPDIPFHVAIDNRARGLAHASAERGADLLVLGAFGDRPPDVGFGTVATSAVRGAPCDVLLVRDTQSGPFRVVVTGIDFSDHSAHALHRAAQIALQDRAELRVLHVFDAPWHDLHYRAPTVEVAPQFIRQYRDGLTRRLEEFARAVLANYSGIAYRCELMDADGHRSAIVDYAQQVNGDLIVLGTRGRTNIRDVLLGSTAEKALRDSTGSVLAVRHPAHSN